MNFRLKIPRCCDEKPLADEQSHVSHEDEKTPGRREQIPIGRRQTFQPKHFFI